MDYAFLIELAVILLCTKLLGIFTKKVSLPQVVGALIAGILLGPAGFGIITETSFLNEVAELGVIVLMFTAGIETDLDALKHSGKSGAVIAVIGVIVPLVAGFFTASYFNRDNLLHNIFIGVILTATSVSITVETLKEMGKLSTRSGNAILAAALIDDVLGIIALTIVTSLAGQGASLGLVLGKIAVFFAISIVMGVILRRLIRKWFSHYDRDKRRFLIVAFALCLAYAYVAEEVFGVADITGAYIIGVIFSGTPKVAYFQDRFEVLSTLLLSPVFFASIGLKVVLPKMNTHLVLFALVLTLVAIASKVVGCGLGAKICGYSGKDSLRIGVGMISRGEVALIVANKGIATGLMSETFFGPVVLVVIVTTVLTPILLKLAYKSAQKDYSDLQESELVNRFEDRADFDRATQMLLEDHDNLQNRS